MESPSFEQQKNDKQTEIDEELDRRVAWARERGYDLNQNDWHPVFEVKQALRRARAFVMYEVHQMLLRADSFELRQTEGRPLNNDLFLLQMCQDFISKKIEELSRIERAQAFVPENKN